MFYIVIDTGIPGVHTTQRNESINSLIKGGNLFANALQEMRLYEAVAYIKDLIDRFLESELDELTKLLMNKKYYCDKVHAHLKASLDRASHACLGKSGWQVEDVADDVVGHTTCAVRENLPKGGFRTHMVTFEEANADKPAICNCLFFESVEIPCAGIVAAVKRLGEDPFDIKWLPSHWHAASHPLATLAMQRVGGCVVEVHHHDVVNDNGANDFEAHALMDRVAKVATIPYPTSERVRRSTMTEAFNSMRDTHHPYNDPIKYKTVMAAIFDLGSGFSGTPGQWIQEQVGVGRSESQRWTANGDLRPPPVNLANPQSATRQSTSTASQGPIKRVGSANMSRSEYRKKWKAGQCATAETMREDKGDWTLCRPAGQSTEWSCPLPGCTNRPIKNTDQSRYAHRCSRKHKDSLLAYPTEASIADGEGASGIPAAGVNGETGIPHGDGDDIQEGIGEVSSDNDTGIPGVTGVESHPHTSTITDSVMQQLQVRCPSQPTMTAMQNAVAQADALGDILRERAEQTWTRSLHTGLSRGDAWSGVQIQPADRLPFMTAEGMSDFKVNQFCEDCKESQLCKTHEAMASNALGQDHLTYLHVSAMKAAGYCMVECGGDGDCFYHSMLFLAQLHRRDLYNAWGGNHDSFRKQSCDKLLVRCYVR
jgi:hypothetical protein